jgi:hypothetical protein
MTKVLTDAVRSALAELSDLDYQSRVWTGRDPRDEMSSFVECVSRLYDDSGLEHALDDGQDVFGAAIDHGLRTLGGLVAKVDSSQAPDAMIVDPLMQRIRVEAAAVLQALEEADYAAE